jgi:uncharacterized membrane protein (DUF4010 family)
MLVEPRSFGYAAGITAALVSALCAAFIAVAPAPAMTLFGLVVHADLTSLARDVTLTAFLAGILFWGLGAGLVFGFAAWLYDQFVAPAPGRQNAEPAFARR